jgi:hypothetical protein
MSLSVSIEPRIRGNMSASKITALFSVLDYVTNADVPAPGG